MSDSGITLESANDGVVLENDLRFNPGGLQMDGSSRNLIQSNTASETTGIGIELGGGSFGNKLVQNTANANAAQGIYIADETLTEPANLLDRNTATQNMSDGIATAKGGHLLIANVTRDNKGWGINAAPGTIDGGDNRASGNGESAQCLGIVCRLLTEDPPLPDPSDPEAPQTTITGGPNAGDGTASFSFTGTDNSSAAADLKFECRLDGQEWAPCSSPHSYANLGSEPHTFEVRAVDEAGNADPTPASHTWTEEPDTVPPETTIGSGPEATTVSTSARFTFSANEPNSRFECSLDGAAFEACTSPKEYKGIWRWARTSSASARQISRETSTPRWRATPGRSGLQPAMPRRSPPAPARIAGSCRTPRPATTATTRS
jgi:large repetitive protein